LVAAPGEAFLYTSAGYTLLSATLAAAENSSFEAVMTEQLWAPLALTSTGLDDVRRIIPRRTRYYVKNENGVLENGPQVDNSFKWAGGGMRSSTHDLAKYGTALMGDEFLTVQEKAVLFTRATESDGQLTAYGLGWYVDIQKFLRDRQQRIPAELYDRLMAQVAGRTLIWHSGTAVGSVAVLMLEPSKGLVLALAVNMGEIEKETIVVALDLLTALAAPG
jgi:CubicO group peptidase (beta-lactamase class C family)